MGICEREVCIENTSICIRSRMPEYVRHSRLFGMYEGHHAIKDGIVLVLLHFVKGFYLTFMEKSSMPMKTLLFGRDFVGRRFCLCPF